MGLTWLGIVVIAILLLMGYSGYRRGFIKEILSFFFVFSLIFPNFLPLLVCK